MNALMKMNDDISDAKIMNSNALNSWTIIVSTQLIHSTHWTKSITTNALEYSNFALKQTDTQRKKKFNDFSQTFWEYSFFFYRRLLTAGEQEKNETDDWIYAAEK